MACWPLVAVTLLNGEWFVAHALLAAFDPAALLAAFDPAVYTVCDDGCLVQIATRCWWVMASAAKSSTASINATLFGNSCHAGRETLHRDARRRRACCARASLAPSKHAAIAQSVYMCCNAPTLFVVGAMQNLLLRSRVCSSTPIPYMFLKVLDKCFLKPPWTKSNSHHMPREVARKVASVRLVHRHPALHRLARAHELETTRCPKRIRVLHTTLQQIGI